MTKYDFLEDGLELAGKKQQLQMLVTMMLEMENDIAMTLLIGGPINREGIESLSEKIWVHYRMSRDLHRRIHEFALGLSTYFFFWLEFHQYTWDHEPSPPSVP